jgi:hypothetical protein
MGGTLTFRVLITKQFTFKYKVAKENLSFLALDTAELQSIQKQIPTPERHRQRRVTNGFFFRFKLVF